jgi:hypothetical protein
MKLIPNSKGVAADALRRIFGKHLLACTLLLAILVAITTTLFFSRSFVLQAQDTSHLQDLYHHSQWTIPLSTRSISDNQLYYVAAVELAGGAHPFSINPEVPPAGKYLYSLGYLLFGNPFVISLVLYVLVVCLTYAVARKLHADRVRSLFAALVISLSPAISSQVAQTMLDLPLLFFLLLHVWALLSLQESRRQWLWVLVAGIALGGFAGTKFPLFAPIVVFADLFFFWKAKKLLPGVVVFAVAGVSFASLYAAYFGAGHSVLEWVKSLYWTLQFYLIGGSEHPYFQVFPGVLFGTYLERAVAADVASTGELTSGALVQWARVREWSLVWPASLCALVVGIWNWLRKKNALSLGQQLVLVLAAMLILLLALVDFKARYFFPLLPLLIAFGVSLVSFKTYWQRALAGVFVVVVLLQYVFFWSSPPSEIVKEVNRTWNAGKYQDLYSFVLPGSTGVDRATFQKVLARQFDQNLRLGQRSIGVSAREARAPELLTAHQLPGELEFTLQSPELTLEGTKAIAWQKQAGEWYLVWDWSWYLDGFSPECEVELVRDAVAGALTTSDGVVLSQYEPIEYLRLRTAGLGTDDATIEALRPLFNTEFARAQVFLQNEIVGREWFDLPLQMSDLTPEQLAVYPERQERWVQYERRTNPRLNEAQQKKVSQLEAEQAQVRGAPGVTIVQQCPSGEQRIVQPGTRENVQLEQSFAEVFSHKF